MGPGETRFLVIPVRLAFSFNLILSKIPALALSLEELFVSAYKEARLSRDIAGIAP